MPQPPQHPARVAVMLSGTGTLFEALLVATTEARVPGKVVLVVSDRPGARGLVLAEDAGIPTAVVALAEHPDRASWDAALAAALSAATPDLVVTAGFMRILGPQVLEAFGGRIVNSHPALLPAFPGAHAVRDALAYGTKVTGCSVHLVDEGVDTGPLLAQQPVPVYPDDDEARLHERIKACERELLVDVVGDMLRHGWTVDDADERNVTIP